MRRSAAPSAKTTAPVGPQLGFGTEGRTIYAIGDIHGHLDLLDALTALIQADAERAAEPGRPLWVFMGDYIDRGPQSHAVIERLIAWTADPAQECVALCGNHEFALIKFLGDASFGPTWMNWGGLPTLRSYGVNPPALGVDAEGWEAARVAFADNLPPSHRDFLLDLPFTHEVGDYFFVHAGARPGTSLLDQQPDDLLMIREEFMAGAPGFEKIVVHGHTPEPHPVNEGWRIGVDTGAYVTGVLTAARIQGHDVSFLQTTASEKTADRAPSGL